MSYLTNLFNKPFVYVTEAFFRDTQSTISSISNATLTSTNAVAQIGLSETTKIFGVGFGLVLSGGLAMKNAFNMLVRKDVVDDLLGDDLLDDDKVAKAKTLKCIKTVGYATAGFIAIIVGIGNIWMYGELVNFKVCENEARQRWDAGEAVTKMHVSYISLGGPTKPDEVIVEPFEGNLSQYINRECS